MTPLWSLHQTDSRSIPLPDASVHCVVTSPPYWALRRYAGAGPGCIGEEATVEEYLAHLLEVFAEVKRVLRDDGVLWVNIGDKRDKGLLRIPDRFAEAMVNDGWTLQDDIAWTKLAPMPESVQGTSWQRCRVKVTAQDYSAYQQAGKVSSGETSGGHRNRDALGGVWQGGATWAACPGCAKCAANDGWVLRRGSWRCTDAWEHIFCFVKGTGYFADGEGVRQPSNPSSVARYHYQYGNAFGAIRQSDGKDKRDGGYLSTVEDHGANLRNVWVLPVERGVPGHYAQFPPSLPARCIQISTSDKGVCPECGAQWARMVEHTNMEIARSGNAEASGIRIMASGTMVKEAETRTVGWRATCAHGDLPPVPATVLDPFAGVGTTLLAASRLGRRSVGVELSPQYVALARQRLDAGAPRF